MFTRFEVPLAGIIRIPFGSYDSSGASVTMTGLSVEDIRIYKDGALLERGPDAGYTVFANFDGMTGLHIIEIDTGEDDSPAGFWTVGSEYNVFVNSVTIDGQTVAFPAAWFVIVATTTASDIHSLVTLIRSDTITLASDLAEGDFSDILSRLTVTNSQVLVIKSDVSDVLSNLASGGGDISDIRSMLSDINSGMDVVQTTVSDIQSDTNVMVPIISDIQSDTSDIQSKLVALAAVCSDIQSDTNVMVPVVSDIQSDTNVLITTIGTAATGILSDINSGINAIQAAGGALTSDQDSKLTAVATTVLVGGTLFELASDIYSDTTAIEAQAGASLTSDQNSKLTAIATTVLVSGTLFEMVSDIYSDTTYLETTVSDVQSDTNVLITTIGTAATGILSDINSGINAIQAAGGALSSDQDSKLTAVATTVLVSGTLFEMVSDIYSDTTHIDSDVVVIEALASDIQSDTNVLLTKVGELDWSDIGSRLTVTNSQLVVVKSDVAHIESDAVVIEAIVSDVQSDTNVLLTKVGELDWSDIGSRLTITNSQMVVIKSDVAHIESDAVVIEAVVSDIQSDTNVLHTTRAEPGQGSPAATATFLTKIDYLYKAWRNKKTQTSSTHNLFADDAATVDQKASVSDDGTTATRGEVSSGP